MSELTARLAIYGAVDRAVADGVVDIDQVVRYLPTYAPAATPESSAAGWYQQLRALAGAGGPVADLGELDLPTALGELARRELHSPLDAEHRLRALFLARVVLFRGDDRSEELLLDALAPVVGFLSDGTARSGADQDGEADGRARVQERVRSLLELIDEVAGSNDGDGYVVMAIAAADHDLIDDVIARIARVPCREATTRFAVPGGTDVDLAARLTATVQQWVPAATIGDLRLVFHPGNWPACLPTFWGAMDPIQPFPPGGLDPTTDPGTERFLYREHVGDQAKSSEWFSPVLEFWYDELWPPFAARTQVNGFSIHYGLPADLPPGVVQDERILLDDGHLSLRVTDLSTDPMEVEVTMLKDLALTPPMPSAGLAVFACAAGWVDHAKALVSGCFAVP